METNLLEQIIGPKGPLSGSKVKEMISVNGGCIHDAWCLKLSNGEKFFAKTTLRNNFDMLNFEASGLNKLNECAEESFLLVPKPLLVQQLETNSILLMPWLDFSKGNEINLGRGLALIHKTSAEQSPNGFGWDQNGYIGLGAQPKGWRKNWSECFVDLRLIPQIKIAEKWGLKLNNLEALLSQITLFLETSNSIPSLVHGDLWSGNAAIDKSGRGVIFDPAIWWADREVDIAMTKLFGGFTNDFYKGYEEIWPLPSRWEERKDLYNLYHVINHANIFGGSYQNLTMKYIQKITSQLKNRSN